MPCIFPILLLQFACVPIPILLTFPHGPAGLFPSSYPFLIFSGLLQSRFFLCPFPQPSGNLSKFLPFTSIIPNITLPHPFSLHFFHDFLFCVLLPALFPSASPSNLSPYLLIFKLLKDDILNAFITVLLLFTSLHTSWFCTSSISTPRSLYCAKLSLLQVAEQIKYFLHYIFSLPSAFLALIIRSSMPRDIFICCPPARLLAAKSGSSFRLHAWRGVYVHSIVLAVQWPSTWDCCTSLIFTRLWMCLFFISPPLHVAFNI